ncbi:MAG: 30S ribosomal protein S16 [Elusimicrobia bacterium]|nr:30S ribosomal protein S16 [Elusimicrobiota bacterium]
MSVAIRLQRTGKPKEAHYRVVAINKSNSPRGKSVEVLGHYHPEQAKDKDRVSLKLDRVEYWIKVGAKPSGTVASLIRLVKRNVAK